MTVHNQTGRTSFTWAMPGGLKVTYSGAPKSYWRWLRETWTGGYVLWRMWCREVVHRLLMGRTIHPAHVSFEVACDIKRAMDKFRRLP